MPLLAPITFVTASNNKEILDRNFLVSPCFHADDHQILVQEGFRSAALAYNDAIGRSQNDLMVFAHQDVIFPSGWLSDLRKSLAWLEREDRGWGVLGLYGDTQDGQSRGRIYWPGRGMFGQPLTHPARVQTLDEIVLIVRKSSGLRFDRLLPHFHFYGTAICLEAAANGKNSYAIPALCIHNAQSKAVLPKEFYECYRYIKRKWKKFLPIQTSCIKITRFDQEMYHRRFREFAREFAGKDSVTAPRIADGRSLLQEIETLGVAGQAKVGESVASK
jgi:hypothetical protein